MRCFLRIPKERYERELAPVLAECRMARSFAPIGKLGEQYVRAMWQVVRAEELGLNNPFFRNRHGLLPFSVAIWRMLVGEVLLAAAADVPILETPLEIFAMLLQQPLASERCRFSPIQRAILGASDLTIGGFAYRPDHAGFNNSVEVIALAGWLQQVDPVAWRLDNLPNDTVIRGDDIAFAKEWLLELARFYGRAAKEDSVVICEDLAELRAA